MERYNSEEECKRVGLLPVPDCPYPVHTPIPPPQQLGKLGLGWVRGVCHTCKLQYDVDQIELRLDAATMIANDSNVKPT